MSKPSFFPLLPRYNVQVGVPTLNLYDGLKLKGVKRWKQAQAEQDFEVEIKHIDKESDLIYGYLTIKRCEKILKTTYFEGEIIGAKNPFLTNKWNADEETDRKHWWKFDAFFNFKYATFHQEDFDYSCLQMSDHVFMRWKETECKTNIGWVAPGFYYVCLTKSTGDCDGIYYENCCCGEWNQDTFSLKQTLQGNFGVYQFR